MRSDEKWKKTANEVNEKKKTQNEHVTLMALMAYGLWLWLIVYRIAMIHL